VDPLSLTAGNIVAATGGRLVHGRTDAAIPAISIDSRSVAAGDLFVAIRGDRFDGHQFVGDALARGAGGVLVEEAAAAAGAAASNRDAIVVAVDDTTRALQQIARDVRRRSGAKVVAITGSAGKTTTKEVAAEFLSARYQVFRNKGNLNNHIGLPLSLLELRSRPDVAVVELGMNHSGELRTLVGIAEPEVRVWTNVGDAHAGFFESIDAIADAKAEILEHAKTGDTIVANADDDRVMSRVAKFTGRVLTFGIDRDADVRATAVDDRGLSGTLAHVRTPAGEATIQTPLLGLGNLANVLAAITVGLHFEVPLETMVSTAAALRPAHSRGELLRLPGGLTLIDDSYNSSPAALKRALQTVKAATGSARKVAVLGEMLELGDHATRLHQESGAAAAAAGLDMLVVVGGPPARALADAAVEAGMPANSVAWMGSSAEAAAFTAARTRPGDLVLVKGSRGVRTDLVVDRLKAEFA
jgi:UDP-N-acetylmuramoyl-tripeptide--D-alanyl-D-alanine ligase